MGRNDRTRTAAGTVSALESRLPRREILRRGIAVGLVAPSFAALLASCATDEDDAETVAEPDDDDAPEVVDDSDDQELEDDEGTPVDDGTDEPRRGGSLVIAVDSEPGMFDIHKTAAGIVAFTTINFYEFLYTWSADLEAVPELAETTEITDDGLTVHFKLLEGVNFHNGEEMTSEDVIASIDRWSEGEGLGAGLMAFVDDVVVIDDYNFEFQMSSPYGPLFTTLAFVNGGCAIFPKSVMDESTPTNLAEPVSTGPYFLAEHAPDDFVRLERFEEYTNREDDTSGFAGRKTQYLDEILFRPVPDTGARIAGLRAGDYHTLQTVPQDQFDTLAEDPDVQAEISDPWIKPLIALNTRDGVMSDITMRRAVQATLDHDEILRGAVGEGFYRLDSSNMMVETPWHTTIGADLGLYNQADPERGAELLEEAGYDDEPIIILTSRDEHVFFIISQIAQQQLNDAGFNVEIEAFDGATVNERRNDPANWDLYVTNMGARVDPQTIAFMQGTSWPGWWDSDRKVELTAQLQSETTFEARYEVWREIEELFYEEVPVIHLGDESSVRAWRNEVQNFEQAREAELVRLKYVNVWIEQT